MRRFTLNGTYIAADSEGDGPAVLFVHGYPLNRTIWTHQLATLTGWHRIAPDLRGMGESEAPAERYNMEVYAADIAALLDQLRVDQVVLCGLSMGGYIAFEFIRRWPSRVRALVLMDTRAEGDTAEGKRIRDATASLARRAGSVAVAEQMLPAMLASMGRGASADVTERVRQMMSTTPVAGIVGALEAMRDRPDSTSLLSTIAVPTLVVVGESDQITPPDQARAMAGAIPGARLSIIPGAGHLPPVERPEVTTETLREFLETLKEGSP